MPRTEFPDGWLRNTMDEASVSMAASQFWDFQCSGKHLDPRLWEALRLLLQERYRRATGEEHAILVIQNRE